METSRIIYEMQNVGAEHVMFIIKDIQGINLGHGTFFRSNGIALSSRDYPGYHNNTLYVQGTDYYGNDRPIVVTKNEAVKINRALIEFNNQKVCGDCGCVITEDHDYSSVPSQIGRVYLCSSGCMSRHYKANKAKTLDSKIQDVIDIQGADGNWDYDEYMHGMYNGMVVVQSIVTDKEPEFREAPDKFLKKAKFDYTKPAPEGMEEKFRESCELFTSDGDARCGHHEYIDCHDCPGSYKYNNGVVCTDNGWCCVEKDRFSRKASKKSSAQKWLDAHPESKQWVTMDNAKDVRIFKAIFQQMAAAGSAEKIFRHFGKTWTTAPSVVSFANDSSSYRLPMPLPELKPLPCSIKLPDGKWDNPKLCGSDERSWHMIAKSSVSYSKELFYGPQAKTKQEAIYEWNLVQEANR